MARRSRRNLEKEALDVIKNSGGNILQSELWKRLKITSREGSRVTLKLEKKGLINRERILHSNRWTYQISLKRTEYDPTPIEGAPCLLCEKDPICNPRSEFSSTRCSLLEEWVLSQFKLSNSKKKSVS